MTELSPDAREELLQAAAALGLTGLTLLARGADNHVFDCEDRQGQHLVVKVSSGGQRARYDTAAWAAQQLLFAGVPAPVILWHGQHLCVETLCPGQPLASESAHPPGPQLRIAQQAGATLRRLHTLPVKGHGRLNQNGIGEHDSIHEWLLQPPPAIDHFPFAVNWAALCDAIRHTLLQRAPLFDPITPQLLHGDFRARHVYADDNATLTGLIDLESVRGGDPLTDLAGWSLQESERLTRALLHGYLAGQQLDQAALTRLTYYRLRIAARLIPWHLAHGQRPWAALHINQIETDLAALKAGTPTLMPSPTPVP